MSLLTYILDSREFQKAHLQRRASDLDKVIENHDKQLDVILNAMNIVNHHDQETLTQQVIPSVLHAKNKFIKISL